MKVIALSIKIKASREPNFWKLRSKISTREVFSAGNSTVSGSQYGVCMYVRLNPSASNVTIIPEQIDLLVSPGNNSKFSGR